MDTKIYPLATSIGYDEGHQMIQKFILVPLSHLQEVRDPSLWLASYSLQRWKIAQPLQNLHREKLDLFTISMKILSQQQPPSLVSSWHRLVHGI
jgi:hypothetical protein